MSRVSVRVTTKSGNHWISTMNGTFESAQEYFKNYVHVTENYETGEEFKDFVVNVELVK